VVLNTIVKLSLVKLPLVKPALAMVLMAVASAANAVTVVLVTHEQTSAGGVVSELITDGSHMSGIAPPSTALFDWDGTTLTSTGLYAATASIGGSPASPTILSDQITDLTIDTGTPAATATAYTCVEGTFLGGVGTNGCGGYDLGVNFADESTTVWGPGLAVSQTIGGDDVLTTGPRTISAYDFGDVDFMDVDMSGGLTIGDFVAIGNGIAVGVASGELMTFEVTSAGAVADAVDDTAGGRANETINIDVLANDLDLVDNITALTITAPSNGTAVLNGTLPDAQGNLSIDFVSAIGFAGDATFDYTVTDANASSDTATVTVTVTNQVPVAVDDISATGVDTPVIVDVLSNDSLGDGPSAAIDVLPADQPPNGNVVVTNSPNAVPANIVVTYTPDSGVTGPDTFTYTLTDDNGDTDTADVTVTTSSALAAVDDSVATEVATEVSIDVLANDANVVNPDFSVDVTTLPAQGVITTGLPVTCTLPVDCALSYMPGAGEVGNDTFVYEVTDNLGAMSFATVTVFINDIPVAVNDPMMTAIPATATSLDVQANDTGLNDTPVTVTVTGGPANGTAVPDAGSPQRVTYTSTVGFIGQDTFTYELRDSNGDTSILPATVTVTVNDQPVANDDGAMGAPAFFFSPGETISLDVLANDTGLADTPLTVTLGDPIATLGAPTVSGSPGDASGIRVDYVAGPSLGTDSFGYQIVDASGDTALAIVYVAVTDQGIPVAVDDAAAWPDPAGPQGLDPDAIFVDVLANDQRLDDAPLTVTITSNPTDGFIHSLQGCDVDQGFCRVWYAPDAGFVGTDTFQYMVTDSTPDSSNIATVTVTVDAVPDAVDDAVSTLEPDSVAIDVLGNDTGLTVLPLTVRILRPPFNGTAVLQADDSIVYTPAAGRGVTTDTFEYRVTDDSGRSSTAIVSVTIILSQDTAPGSSSAMGPVGLGLLALLTWLRRRQTRVEPRFFTHIS